MMENRLVKSIRALISLAVITPGVFVPPNLLNLYIKLVDFTGLVWILRIQPYNYPYYTLLLRPFYLLLPEKLRGRIKKRARRLYERRDYYRNLQG
jgi:hypothetical protein